MVFLHHEQPLVEPQLIQRQQLPLRVIILPQKLVLISAPGALLRLDGREPALSEVEGTPVPPSIKNYEQPLVEPQLIQR